MSTLELLHQLTCKIIYNLLNIKKTFLFLYIFQQKEFETSKSTKKNTIVTFTEFQGHQVKPTYNSKFPCETNMQLKMLTTNMCIYAKSTSFMIKQLETILTAEYQFLLLASNIVS